MDKDRVVGKAKEIKGTVEEALGKAIGSTKLTAEGKSEQAAGKVQAATGTAQDAAKDALKNEEPQK
jgi:uncharacterized protein YjbJ (UPF0337 family)